MNGLKMALLLGASKPLPPDLTSGYQVFHRLAISESTRDHVALMTDNLRITFQELQRMVDSLEVWLVKQVDCILKRESQKLANYEKYRKESDVCSMSGEELKNSQTMKQNKDQEKDAQGENTSTRNGHCSSDQTLEATKVGKYICIALCLNRSPTLVALILAIWKLGWSYVPLDPAVPGVRTLYVLRDAEPACIITDENSNIKIRALESDTSIHPQNHQDDKEQTGDHEMSEFIKYTVNDRIINIDTWEQPNSDSDEGKDTINSSLLNDLRGSGKLACLLYTSGSTGNPKGVLLTMDNLMNRIYWQWNEFPFKPDEVCLMTKSLTFVDSVTELFTPLLAGIPVAVVKELHINPELVIKYVGQFGVSRLVFVPSLLKLLLLYLNTTKDSIRLLQLYLHLWISSGEPIPGWLLNDFFAMFPGSKFVNLYGSTEVTGDVTFLQIEETTWKAGVKVPIGRPISNTVLIIIKKNKQIYTCAKEEEDGEIAVISKNVCAGYHHGKQYNPDTNIFVPLSNIEVKDDEKREALHSYVHELYENKLEVKSSNCVDHMQASVTEDEYNKSVMKDIQLLPETTVSDSMKQELVTSSVEVKSPKRSPSKVETHITSFFKNALSPSKSKQTQVECNKSPFQSPVKILSKASSPSKTRPEVCEVSSLKELSLKSARSATRENALPEPVEPPSSSRDPTLLKKVVAYRTGDWGKIVRGKVIFEGRKDSQVKVRGVRVQLAEVDDGVHRSGYTNAHCVLAATEQDTEDEDQVLVAFVVLKPEFEERDTPITEDLLRCLKSYLPEVMVPRVVVLDSLPHLPSGKVDRQALLKIYRKRMSHRCSKDNILILRKDEPIESRVLRIICSALGLSRSQDVLSQNFFALGGSSITSVSVVVRLRDLGLDVTLETFLKANTIGEVVNDILKAKTMAEVMNFFCSPSPGIPSSSVSVSQSKKCEEEFEEDEDEDPVCDLSIPALHPDIPVCTSHQKSKKSKGLRLALLHTQPLSQGVDKQSVIEILAESFTTKNPLDVAVGVPKAAHRCLLNALWPRLVQDDLSFVVKDPQRGILGAVINTDFFNEPQIRVPPSMREVAALHETLEEEARQTLKQEKRGQRWVHNLFLATNNCLSAQDNVRLVLHLEKELLRVSQTRQYHGVFTVNSNPLNQLLCENYLGYRRRSTVRVASFCYEGRQPFGRLPHDLLLVAMTKAL